MVETLLGVVVGALLGAILQYLADRRREHKERAQELRALQTAAYGKLLEQGFPTLDVVSRFAASTPGTDDERSLLLALKEQVGQMMATAAQISLLAPADTARCAHDLVDATLLIASGGPANAATNGQRRDAAATAFLMCARRDLGVKLA